MRVKEGAVLARGGGSQKKKTTKRLFYNLFPLWFYCTVDLVEKLENLPAKTN
jgi:hypothetical protein